MLLTIFERNDQEVGAGLVHKFGDLAVAMRFADNFNVWLFRHGSEHEFSHQTRPIGYEDPYFLHGPLLDAPVFHLCVSRVKVQSGTPIGTKSVLIIGTNGRY